MYVWASVGDVGMGARVRMRRVHARARVCAWVLGEYVYRMARSEEHLVLIDFSGVMISYIKRRSFPSKIVSST